MTALVVFIASKPTRKARVVIRTESGSLSYLFPFASAGHSRDGEAPGYVDVSRPGLAPLNIRQNLPIPTLSFTARLAQIERQPYHGGSTLALRSVEPDMATLRTIAASTERIVVENYGPSAGGYWRFDDLSFQSLLLDPATNETLDGTCSIRLKRAVDLPTSFTMSANSKTKSTSRIYTWHTGDTLQKVSQKFYRTTTKWRIIADANHIRDVRKIRNGQRLVIPPV